MSPVVGMTRTESGAASTRGRPRWLATWRCWPPSGRIHTWRLNSATSMKIRPTRGTAQRTSAERSRSRGSKPSVPLCDRSESEHRCIRPAFARAKSHTPSRCPCVTPEVVGQRAEKVVARSRDAPADDEDLRVVCVDQRHRQRRPHRECAVTQVAAQGIGYYCWPLSQWRAYVAAGRPPLKDPAATLWASSCSSTGTTPPMAPPDRAAVASGGARWTSSGGAGPASPGLSHRQVLLRRPGRSLPHFSRASLQVCVSSLGAADPTRQAGRGATRALGGIGGGELSASGSGSGRFCASSPAATWAMWVVRHRGPRHPLERRQTRPADTSGRGADVIPRAVHPGQRLARASTGLPCVPYLTHNGPGQTVEASC